MKLIRRFCLQRSIPLRSITFDLRSLCSSVDFFIIIILTQRDLNKFRNETKIVHDCKLKCLGLNSPTFISPDKVIFNFFNYVLTTSFFCFWSLSVPFIG